MSMGAHEKAIKRITNKIRLTRRTGVGSVDQLLEDLYDVTHRATEWDADQWGFDPGLWMQAERNVMDVRARNMGFWPREVSKHELAIGAGAGAPD